jgi:FlaA1/EpsC-like NDP-sugar epimerase
MTPIDLDALIGRTPHLPDLSAMHEAIVGRTVLVTGAAGSIGSELCRNLGVLLAATGNRDSHLVMVDRAENAAFLLIREMRENCPHLKMDFPIVDVTDRAGIRRTVASYKPSLVIHAAAYKHVPLMEAQPTAAIVNNVLGTRNVAEACAAAGVERLVYISTDKAVAPRSATKFLGELLCRRHLPKAGAWSSVRFGNVLASSCSVLAIWHEQVAAGEPLTLTDPDMTRYFMSIPEAATLALAAAGLAGPGEFGRYLLDMGEPVRMGDLARRFLAAMGVPDHPIVEVGAREGEKRHEALLDDGETAEATAQPGVLRIRGREVIEHTLEGSVGAMEYLCGEGEAEKAAEVLARELLSQHLVHTRAAVAGQEVACGAC